jgi:hypothetical protein
MMPLKIALSLIVMAACSTVAASSAPNLIPQYEGDQNERSVLALLGPLLRSSGKAARIYYGTDCQPDSNYPIPFPRLAVRPPRAGIETLSAFQEIFRNSKKIMVTEKKVGVIRISIGHIPHSILRTKISILSLKPTEQYDAQSAIRAIESTIEFREALRKSGLQGVSRVSNQLVQSPADGLPRLPSSMTNVTVDDALDEVATTFKIVVVFGYCSSPPTFELTSAGSGE